jgi:hypothetical protein
MKVLELFAGSRSIGKVFDENDIYVYSTDIEQFENIDLCVDILEFDYKSINFVPDFIWASPPCTAFSVASIGKNWVSGFTYKPKTEKAEIGILILNKTIEIIQYFLKLNPSMIWYLENPRGKMRKSPIWDKFENIRHTVTYCQYGDTRMKPTDIWTNDKKWKPLPMCKNGDTCHTPAPRGSQTGTQSLKGNFERSKIPYNLCKEIVENYIFNYD